MSTYRFDRTRSFDGKVYFADSEHELTDAQARALGFEVKEQPKTETKQVEDYANRQIKTAPKSKKGKKGKK